MALCGVGALLLAEGASGAEPLAPVTVIAQGRAPFLTDLTLEEVRGRARDDARRSAVEQAVGVFVRGSMVVHNSQIVEELVTTLSRGVIEQEQWLEERIEEVPGEQGPGSAMAVYRAKLRAQIRPVRVERRTEFELYAHLNKHVYQDQEEAWFTVRSSRDAYLHVFSVTQDGSVTLLLPNRFQTLSQMSAQQELIFPNESLREQGVRLRVMLPKGAKTAREYIKVIATRRPVHLVKHELPGSVFHTFSGSDPELIQDIMKRLALLEDEDWTEATVPYQISR